MSMDASGAAMLRALDPQTDPHYCLSEDAHYELRTMFDAMRTLAHVFHPFAGEIGPEIDCPQIAPILDSFAMHGLRVVADMRAVVTPGRAKGAAIS